MVRLCQWCRNYIRVVKDKRKNYQRDQIEDVNILAILDTVTGAFERSRTTDKATQDKIVKKMEQEQEAKIFEEMTEEEAQGLATQAESGQTETQVANQPKVVADGEGLVTTRPKPKIK